MKKLLFSLCCFLSFGFGGVDDKIREIIGEESYNANRSFINVVFQNKARFYANGQINISAIIRELKNNGLIALKFPKPMDLNITFISQTSPILLTYMINNTLSSMGYSYFMVSKSSFVRGLASVSFSLVTEHSIDPIILISELQKRGFKLTDIKRNAINDWEYFIDVQNPRLLNAKTISLGERLSLREVSGEYWLQLRQTGTFRITANPRWMPHIVCYDRNLRIVNLITPNKPSQTFYVNISDGVNFVMITDAINPHTIKDGLEVTLSNF